MHELQANNKLKECCVGMDKELPFILIELNKERIFNLKERIDINRIEFYNIEFCIDLMLMCEQDPRLANNLFFSTKQVIEFIEKNIYIFLNNFIKLLGIKLEINVRKLINVCLTLNNIPMANKFILRRFYNRIYALNEDHLLTVLETKSQFIRKDCVELMKYFRCDNDICSKSSYIIEQEKSINGITEINHYIVDTKEDSIKTVIERNLFLCIHCHSPLKENLTEKKANFIFLYKIYHSLLFFDAISQIQINSKRFLIGYIYRRKLVPTFFILGETDLNDLNCYIDFKSFTHQSFPLYLKGIYSVTHSQFVLDDNTHIDLNLVLSIFHIRNTTVNIYTNDVYYIKNYALSYFSNYSLEVPVFIEEKSVQTNKLVIFNEKNINQLNNSEFNFIIELKNNFINYEYAPSKHKLYLSQHKLHEESHKLLQNTFLSLRSVFKDKTSPFKLLEIIKILSDAFCMYVNKQPNIHDLRLIEKTCVKCIVPDLNIKILAIYSKK